MSKEQEKIDKASKFILEWGCVDGGHHKQWTLDQVLRILVEDKYDDMIEEFEDRDADGEPQYLWEDGIAP